jgi:large subunit ribosomal protein L21
MIAVVETGGKQYRVTSDDVFYVEKLEGNPGDTVEITNVLMLTKEGECQVGAPYVAGAKVKATIVRQTKGPKINAFNYKAKKNVQRRWGHRQFQTHLKVVEIIGGK